jgi:hypothetical protein
MARRDGVGLAVLAVALLAAWWFWDTVWVWPLKVLVVLFHELGHAIVAWATGGEVLEIGLNPNQSGHTRSAGGWPLLILNGGYLGSLGFGVALLAAGRRPRSARVVAFLLPVAILAVAAWTVRPLLGFGFAFTAATGALLLAAARWAPDLARQQLLRGIGAFSVLYALIDIRDDVFRAPAGAVSDATMLAQLTGVPAAVWGVGWIAAGVATLWVLRRWLV